MEFLNDTFDYHINWKSRGYHPGQHKSDQRGMGIEFAGHATIIDYPDPRRIDIRQTIRDPFEQIQVRIFNQRSATPVIIASDLSASMNFGGDKSKHKFASEIASIITHSVMAKSDAIGFIGFNDKIDSSWVSSLSYRPHRTEELIKRLASYHAKSAGHHGIRDLYEYVPKDQTLIFLISDFHMPIDDISSALGHLRKHRVIPIILWNKSEYEGLPKFGVITINDPESGQEQTIFLRGNMLEKIKNSFKNRKAELEEVFLKHDSPPFFVGEEFDTFAMSQYFNEYFHA
ncbi:MAG: hypothetical protein ABS29_02820 [Methylophilales bacterium BACL14 MAG-120920-bin58]|jgi:uncharacterized protein (DUF58 family)|nr:MAG: hypothetical protein ABS29_02820 [Methylophilales bacterium BACL14 MAG-120920-bin58]